MELYNLLHEPWIPVRTKGGSDWVRPCDFARTEKTIIAIDWNRPDFNAATLEFLIGLLQTCFAPKDEKEWYQYYLSPPSLETLQKAFCQYEVAFNLNGDGYRFMQDRSAQADTTKKNDWEPVTKLLIDAPGGNTVKENKDHFVKRSEGGFSLPVAAIALYTLQAFAPSGGQGHRTSMRGGGPLTTLVIATQPINSDEAVSLWQTLWVNVLPLPELQREIAANTNKNSIGDIFPWMQPMRLSNEKNSETIPDMTNLCMPYWSTPRRIFYDFTLSPIDEKPCLIEDKRLQQVLVRYSTKNYGENYPTNLWTHPLSPYYNDGKQFLPQHPQPGGIRWGYWLGCVGLESDGDDEVKCPALTVRYFRQKRLNTNRQWCKTMRVRAFGYDMNNMEARCWYEGEMPILLNEVDEGRVRTIIIQSVEAATEAAYTLNQYTKQFFHDTQAIFWSQTEQAFYTQLGRLAELVEFSKEQANPNEWLDAETDNLHSEWFNELQRICFKVADELAYSYPPENAKMNILKGKKVIGVNIYQELGKFKKWFGVNVKKKLNLTNALVEKNKKSSAKKGGTKTKRGDKKENSKIIKSI